MSNSKKRSDSKNCPNCEKNPCCCPIGNTNKNTFNPTINVNPVINISSTPVNGEQGLLTEFDGSVLPGSDFEPIRLTPITIGTATLHIDDPSDRVLLHATIHSINPNTFPILIRFSIFRNGTEIFSTTDNIPFLEFMPATTTGFSFLDKAPLADVSPSGLVLYELKTNSLRSEASFKVGGSSDTDFIVFTASKIKANNPNNI
ncbi:hypothetical protein COJ96_27880 [Bacillus sp. AFS073361]|uniref:hypothetical protein n=1 Tax=Bacillus sp. AFS073361 TaxID=2033511 RepID=UPI000BF6AE86|nr:hypothetical protein [Bacillus sp. AFS073361]PFP15314.1 hypothetical protein COJ96_27880 [Bacillus sp. AFS073361]